MIIDIYRDYEGKPSLLLGKVRNTVYDNPREKIKEVWERFYCEDDQFIDFLVSETCGGFEKLSSNTESIHLR